LYFRKPLLVSEDIVGVEPAVRLTGVDNRLTEAML